MRTALLLAFLAAPAAAGGRALFDASGCSACHSVGGKGGNAGPDLSFVGFRRTGAWLDAWLKDPHAVKPDTLMPRPGLSAGDRRGLLEYLSGLQGQDLPPGSRPWDAGSSAADPVGRGRVLYAKAGCAACHGPEGRGGHPNAGAKGGRIPALRGLTETYSPDELAARIRNGSRPEAADPAGPEPAALMPAWGEKLGDAEIRAVAAYLLTLGGEKPKEGEW